MVNNNMSDCECTKNNSEVCVAKEKNCIDNSKYDNHGCNTTIGEFWCPNSNKCNQADEKCVNKDNNLDDIINNVLYNLPESQIDDLKKNICSKEIDDLNKPLIDKHGCNISKKEYYCYHTDSCLNETDRCVEQKKYDCNGCLIGEEKYCKSLEKCIMSNQDCAEPDIKDLYGCNISNGEQYCQYTNRCETRENCVKPTPAPTTMPAKEIDNYCNSIYDCSGDSVCQNLDSGACYTNESYDCEGNKCKCIPKKYSVCLPEPVSNNDMYSPSPIETEPPVTTPPVTTPPVTTPPVTTPPVTSTPVTTPPVTSTPVTTPPVTTPPVTTAPKVTKKPKNTSSSSFDYMNLIPISSSSSLFVVLLILLVMVYYFKVLCY